MRLALLSYNIHKGFSALFGRFVLDKMRLAIHDIHADLVFLQEVQGQHFLHEERIEGWPEQSQFEYLADTLWTHYAYGKNAIYQEGHHGNAILSKYPFMAYENIDISGHPLEQRGLLHGVIAPEPDRRVHVFCVHFGLLESWRRKQVLRLCQRIREHVPEDEPIVIAGDFNDWRNNVTPYLERQLGLREVFIARHGQLARTFPSFWPAFHLDRVYVRGFHVNQAACLAERPWLELSDHLVS